MFLGFIPKSPVLRRIVLGWILIYRYWFNTSLSMSISTLNLRTSEERSKPGSLLPLNINLDHDVKASAQCATPLRYLVNPLGEGEGAKSPCNRTYGMWTGREDWVQSFLHEKSFVERL